MIFFSPCALQERCFPGTVSAATWNRSGGQFAEHTAAKSIAALSTYAATSCTGELLETEGKKWKKKHDLLTFNAQNSSFFFFFSISSSFSMI